MASVAMVLAAGFGTRLRPLTEELPKPLVPVGDRSLLAHICGRLAAAGVRKVVLNAHHLLERYDDAVLAALGVEVAMVTEARILGTAGGVHGAATALGAGPVLVHNGDIMADLDVAALVAQHREGAVATLAVHGEHPVGQGTVGLDAGGRVVRLRDQRFGEEARGTDFIGVQLLSAAGRERLPEEGCLVGDVYLPALAGGAEIGAAEVAGFVDVGTLASYGEANRAWLGERTAWVGEGAEVAPEIELAGSVVGAGAVLGGSGEVRDSVIWPGARAEAPLEGVVVTTGGRVVPWR